MPARIALFGKISVSARVKKNILPHHLNDLKDTNFLEQDIFFYEQNQIITDLTEL